MSKIKLYTSIGAMALIAAFVIGVKANTAEAATTTNAIKVQGTITAISGTTLPAVITMTSGATTYTVNIASTTKIVRKYNGSSDLSEFIVGDIIQVTGKLSDAATNTIDATTIKDLSVQRIGGNFKGYIVALDCTNNKFTFKPTDREQQTVIVNSSTKIIRNGLKIKCTDLVAKEKTKVIGIWRTTTKEIMADRIIVYTKSISGTISGITLTDGGLPATLTVALKNKQTWTVNVTSTTKLFRKFLGKATIEEFLVGDKIEAHGSLAETNTLNALMVRNTSISVKYSDFKGTVKSIDAVAGTFVLRINSKKYGDITVTTSTSTKYYDHETVKAFTDIAVGDKLKVLGAYTSSTKKLAATRVFWQD
ncbi:MAG: DUF5666 domain-containing protein [Patescibacteria group bacterium]|jgi:hypothetical protein